MQKIGYTQTTFFIIVLLLSLASCKKAQDYYVKLYNQPEIIQDYQSVYGVNDTITFTGRLNPDNNLIIRIGKAEGEIVGRKKVFSISSYGRVDTLDEIKVLISETMGIGISRPISITSAGNTIAAPAIEIYEGANIGLLPKPLKLVEHYKLPAGTIPLYCLNGNGNTYVWESGKGIVRITKQGTTQEVLGATNLSDGYGAFAITDFNSGGIDPNEQFLYFSAITTDGSTDGAKNEIYRLCRLNLQSNILTTLNRTPYPKETEQRTLTSAMPFEGEIGVIKFYKTTAIYPDREGNVFFDLMGSYITRLDKNGNYHYLFSLYPSGTFIPEIINPQLNRPYHQSTVHELNILPGTKINAQIPFIICIDPEEQLLYASSIPDGSGVLAKFDLASRVQLEVLSRPFLNTNAGDKPYLSGSFGILTGSTNYNPTPAFCGYLPLPDKGLLLLSYQSLADGGGYMYPANVMATFPAWTILDFKVRRGIRYAPGKLERGSYRIQSTDRLLNYDAEGMLYMTTNSNSAIVKTTYR